MAAGFILEKPHQVLASTPSHPSSNCSQKPTPAERKPHRLSDTWTEEPFVKKLRPDFDGAVCSSDSAETVVPDESAPTHDVTQPSPMDKIAQNKITIYEKELSESLCTAGITASESPSCTAPECLLGPPNSGPMNQTCSYSPAETGHPSNLILLRELRLK